MTVLRWTGLLYTHARYTYTHYIIFLSAIFRCFCLRIVSGNLFSLVLHIFNFLRCFLYSLNNFLSATDTKEKEIIRSKSHFTKPQNENNQNQFYQRVIFFRTYIKIVFVYLVALKLFFLHECGFSASPSLSQHER